MNLAIMFMAICFVERDFVLTSSLLVFLGLICLLENSN